MIWHIVTGEYPPRCGGIGDYVALLSDALYAEGDDVLVWVPPGADAGGNARVRALPDRFGTGSHAALAAAQRTRPGTLLLQYVPNALGARGANLGFCLWLRAHGRTADVRVMFHEPYFYFTARRPWRNGLAIAQRLMARRLLQASRHVYMSTENWTRYLRSVGPVGASTVLAVPSTIPRDNSTDARAVWRARMDAGDAPVLGHFGTYGVDVAGELERALPYLAERFQHLRFALIGDGGRSFAAALATRSRSLDGRMWSSDRLSPAHVAAALRACDMLLQPYPDGVTTRRTSVMAGLHNAIATIATEGFLTEGAWRESGAVALVGVDDRNALAAVVRRWIDDPGARASQALRGQAAYDAHFSMAHTIAALRSPG